MNTVADQPPIRTFLVDDHAIVRFGMRTFLEMLGGIEITGEACDGQAALDHLAALANRDQLPHVVLMDLLMPRLDGIAATRAIKQRFPTVEVVILTTFGEGERVHAALEAGAAGYLLKDAEADQVGRAIRAAHRGQIHLDPAVTRQITQTLVAPQRSASSALTPRERQILIHVARGESNNDIARALVISERTARAHVSNILGKLGLTSRTQAALWAIREGLVAPS